MCPVSGRTRRACTTGGGPRWGRWSIRGRVYPEADLAPAQRRLTLFLAQYWGGPRTYDQERGHPRLRMRHVPFAIDADARDRWLVHMRAALAAEAPPSDVAVELERYIALAAEAMRNRE